MPSPWTPPPTIVKVNIVVDVGGNIDIGTGQDDQLRRRGKNHGWRNRNADAYGEFRLNSQGDGQR
jgi:hypothetical protein